MNLNKIGEQVRRCTRCILWKHRLQALPGSGDQGAKYLVVLESPDEHADRLGEIWEGLSGKKLKKLMKEQNVNIDDVFLTTLVKCSPHGSEVDDLEIEECGSYLKDQIKQLEHVKKIFVVSDKESLNLPKKAELVSSVKKIKF